MMQELDDTVQNLKDKATTEELTKIYVYFLVYKYGAFKDGK